jgi:cysteinyl-tRNA synthetase
MRLHDTMTGDIVEFESQRPPIVTMYVCGVTVYDSPHVGHARSAVAFDVLRRYLEYRGYDVIFAKNFTDIDDRMIERANERGITIGQLGRQYIDEYEDAMAALNVKPPIYAPRATNLIPDMITFIQRLEDSGHAYNVNGNVYFDVDSVENYGRLSRKPAEEIEDINRRDSEEFADEKRNPRDFALWKRQKEGEPAWESPWGPGRPGWHIECSVMSTKLLGETIDIHGGGLDLVFPHHENEIAQSEAASGKQFCRYWVHNGFVTINKEKMSKSLHNFFTISEVLAEYEAPALRMFLISAQYRSPLNFDKDQLDQATKNWHRIRDAWRAGFGAVGAEHVVSEWTPVPRETLDAGILEALDEFEAAMDEDLNTPRAIAAVFTAAKIVNELAATGAEASILEPAFLAYRRMIAVLGFDIGYLKANAQPKAAAGEQLDALVQKFIEERAEARKAKDFAKADEIRDYLTSIGIELADSKDDTTWKLAE